MNTSAVDAVLLGKLKIISLMEMCFCFLFFNIDILFFLNAPLLIRIIFVVLQLSLSCTGVLATCPSGAVFPLTWLSL